jgi:hypothetical protein
LAYECWQTVDVYQEDDMYMAIHRYAADAGVIESMMKRVSGELADRIPGQVGSVLYAAVDTGDGTATTVTVFADEAAARRAAGTVAQVQQRLGAEFGVVEHEVIEGPVVISRATELLLRDVDPE